MPKDPMMFFPYTFCPNCKSNSIEIYSWHNYGQKYDKILDQYKKKGTIDSTLNKYGIFTMRCHRCGIEYKMYWEDGLPKPIFNGFYTNLFMSKFKDDSIKGRPHIIDNIYEKRMSE